MWCTNCFPQQKFRRALTFSTVSSGRNYVCLIQSLHRKWKMQTHWKSISFAAAWSQDPPLVCNKLFNIANARSTKAQCYKKLTWKMDPAKVNKLTRWVTRSHKASLLKRIAKILNFTWLVKKTQLHFTFCFSMWDSFGVFCNPAANIWSVRGSLM